MTYLDCCGTVVLGESMFLWGKVSGPSPVGEGQRVQWVPCGHFAIAIRCSMFAQGHPNGPGAMSSGVAGAVRLAAIVVTVVGALRALRWWILDPPRLHPDDEEWIYEDPTPPSDHNFTVDGHPLSPASASQF